MDGVTFESNYSGDNLMLVQGASGVIKNTKVRNLPSLLAHASHLSPLYLSSFYHLSPPSSSLSIPSLFPCPLYLLLLPLPSHPPTSSSAISLPLYPTQPNPPQYLLKFRLILHPPTILMSSLHLVLSLSFQIFL